MHSDFQISSAAPKASIFYSRYFSLNDVRDRKEENLPILRCTSLQWLTEKEKENFAKNCENGKTFEAAVKLLNTRVKKKEEKKQLSSENDFALKEKVMQNFSDETEGLSNEDKSEKENLSAKCCQCSKENNICSTARGSSRKSHSSRKMKNVLSTLDEEVPAETRCERCHLEIRDESRKKERIIELWMQFFG